MRVKKTNPTPEQLSAREQVAVLFIEACRIQGRRAPTYREISQAINLSLSATHDLVQRLVEYGYVKRRSRGISRDVRVIRLVPSELLRKAMDQIRAQDKK